MKSISRLQEEKIRRIRSGFTIQSRVIMLQHLSVRTENEGKYVYCFNARGKCGCDKQHKKNIKIVSIPKMISDMTQLVKYIKIDSLMAGT